MEEALSYLGTELGLSIDHEVWPDAASLPIYLSKAADYWLCSCNGAEFIAAKPHGKLDLPALKRLVSQISDRSNMPVALIGSNIEPRQRRALTAQQIAYVVPKKAAYLPFMHFTARSGAGQPAEYKGALSARAQAFFVAKIANPEVKEASALREITGLSASDITKAIAELFERGIVVRGKTGRKVTVNIEDRQNNAIKHALALGALATPVERELVIRTTNDILPLPDAGETALAARSMLTSPKTTCKAISKRALKSLTVDEIMEGEEDADQTVKLQVWKYEPLCAGFDRVDDLSLALSLKDIGDERIEKELNALFNEEDLW